jgi:integrase/recombinase XerD
LLDSINTSNFIGLRDRATIGVMVYSFARVPAVVRMNVEHYYTMGKRAWIRLHEKGGKRHEVNAHPNAVEYLNAYLIAASINEARKTPLFRTIRRQSTSDARSLSFRVTDNRMARTDGLSRLAASLWSVRRASGVIP